MHVYILIITVLLWTSWWYLYGTESNVLLVAALILWWLLSIDTPWSNILLLFSIGLGYTVVSKYSSSLVQWSEFNGFLIATLLLFASTALFWSSDFTLGLISIELIHLLMCILLLNGQALNRILVFLITGWVLTALILLLIPFQYAYSGELDLINVLSSGTTNKFSLVLCMLLLGKTYIIPWVLICSVVYSSIKFDALLVLSLLFSTHFGLLLVTSVSDQSNPTLLFGILILLLTSTVFATYGFMMSNNINLFLGYSFCITSHLLLIYAVLGTLGTDLGLYWLVLYIYLLISFTGLLYILSNPSSMESFDGLFNVSSTVTVLMVTIILMFLGLPPSLLFFAKIGTLGSIYQIVPWVAALLISLVVVSGYIYIRLVLRLCMVYLSSADIIIESQPSNIIIALMFMVVWFILVSLT